MRGKETADAKDCESSNHRSGPPSALAQLLCPMRDKDGLVLVTAQVDDVKTVKPWMLLLGQHHTEHHTLKLGYPVCPKHAPGLSLAHWITRNGGLPRFLRWMVYFVVGSLVLGLGIALFAMLTKAGVNVTPAAAKAARAGPTDWGSALSGLSTLLVPLAAAGFIVRSFKKIPLRLTRLEDDAVTIRFKVDRYARAFERSNSDIVV